MPIPVACQPQKIAGMTPTDEQAQILDTAKMAQDQKLPAVVIGAGAGTGKTATLRMLELVLVGKGQYTAFNRSLVEESKTKFTRASANTTHSLAFRAVGKNYAHRLNGPRIKSDQVAQMLGIGAMTVHFTNTDGEDQKKVLDPGVLAGQAMQAVRRFCQSDEKEITLSHFPYIDGIDSAYIDEEGTAHRGSQNNQMVKEYLLPFAQKAWVDLCKIDGVLPYFPDAYVKVWELNKPYIAADYILLDEAQDSAPVVLSILQQQTHAMLILVGDENQSIYQWRGAVDAMKAFPDAPRNLLSQSFRFGQHIADVANAILQTLGTPTDLVMKGLKTIRSKVEEIKNPKCILCRTNAKAVSHVLQGIKDRKRPHLIGGGSDVVDFCKAAKKLKAGSPTSHADLACFTNWAEVVKYSKTDEGSDLELLVRLIEEFGDEILKALENMPEEKDADFVVSTAHKSKGRQWPSVKLADDFPTANRMGDADRRLLYVAATRAQFQLDITDCPPFTVRRDPYTGEAIDVIEVDYTELDESDFEISEESGIEVDIVTRLENAFANSDAESFAILCDQLRQLLGLEVETASAVVASDFGDFSVVEPVTVTPTVEKEESEEPDFTWYKVNGDWTACGTPGMKGERVNVYRKGGSYQTVTLGEIVRKFPDNWCYLIEE